MNFILMLKAAILGVVEGLTEFLPISSTGHLIVAQSFLGLKGEFWDSFEVAIQFGAIIAVMWEFRERITGVVGGVLRREREAIQFVLNIVIATLPVLVLAAVFGKHIKAVLFNPIAVALAFIVGGVIIYWAERRQVHHQARVVQLEDLSSMDALKVGLAQTLAVLFPGTSRSGATIIGGMFFGLSRQVATYFSFFLAMPVLFIACVKGLWDMRHMSKAFVHNGVAMNLTGSDMVVLFSLGFVFALVSAFVCVRWLLRFVSNHNFIGFAWYRIVFGVLILLTYAMGWMTW
ncbi:MAG: uppP [Burkholderiaceae bacterium]|nr:uppP [Burkholderiaceae bacterium]